MTGDTRAQIFVRFPLVGWFGKTVYDRDRTLARAARFESKRQRRKAIAEYRKAVQHERGNAALLAKLGALLARTRQLEEARKYLLAAAEIYEKESFEDKALAIYLQAADISPEKPELFERIARLEAKRERPADAVRALLVGARHQRGRKLRPRALRMLREAVKIQPLHFEATFELARLLGKEGKRAEAENLYAQLCARERGRELRRARAAWFRLSLSPAAAWGWLRAALLGR